ncbi:hypothetical protein [Halioxenophilus aromaticivorans]|uniref:hypothetical protein n=1 Tax=Halioxenophilus aromaticivorans TaxID=1306992 RepID=UPI0031EB167F
MDFTLKQDYQARVKNIVSSLKRVIPGADIPEKDVLALLEKVYSSPEYKKAKVDAYKEHYTAEELMQIYELLKDPAYQLLLARQQAVMQASNAALTPMLQKEMQAFISSHLNSQK